jgi:hypothetical protein
MKRLLFVFLILIVLAVTGFYVMNAFSIPAINFVADHVEVSTSGNEMAIRRLYTGEVDIDAFYESMEGSLVSAEFTDDEIYNAALAAGDPQFFPAFYFEVLYNNNSSDNVFNFSGSFRQEFVPGQTEAPFTMSNLHMEVTSETLRIRDFSVVPINPDEAYSAAPVISEDEHTLAVNLIGVGGCEMDFAPDVAGAANGRVTFRFTYDVVTTGILPNTALSGQYLEVYADMSYTSADGLKVSYISEPYSSLDDLEY